MSLKVSDSISYSSDPGASMASEESWSLFPYDPNKALPIIFAVLVTAIALAHVYLSFIKYQWRWYGSVIVWASTVWVAGFICRAYAVWHVQNVGMFIAQYTMILVGPPLYAAAAYFVLERLMNYLPYHAPIHPNRVISTFVILSAAVESMTASGASNSAGAGRDPRQRANGLALIKAALILQAVVEVGFSSLVLLMELRCRKAGHFTKSVRTVCYTLYVTSIMMLVRCIVRAVEGFEAAQCDAVASDYKGYCGNVSTHEWFLWVFEVANITLFLTLLAIFPPGKFLPRDRKVYLDLNDSHLERLGPGFGKASKRPIWVTVLDPFDIVGIVSGHGHKVEPYWLEEHPVYTRQKKASVPRSVSDAV